MKRVFGPGEPAYQTGPTLWRVIAGFIVWAIAFLLLYVGHAVACLHAPTQADTAAVSAGLVVLWLALLAITIVLAVRSQRCRRAVGAKGGHQSRFSWRLTFLLDLFAAGAVVLTGLPLLVVPACMS
ncbi:MAG TPA: hypothetical protein VL003_05685 [Pusillimonas sp.]|uniref:hypothetical protein n=1 Tax=Pusillimonas sp. TaxID=3040095 RepID=UPI002BBD7DDB|nr:hypothetical protein [Pusillimonas sp.]HUH87529.1 hypothetical protein [Pusillimonas sp.]